jgi:hypothetical protein
MNYTELHLIKNHIVTKTPTHPRTQSHNFPPNNAHKDLDRAPPSLDPVSASSAFEPTVAVPAERLLSGQEVEDWFLAIGARGKPYKSDTALRLRFQFHLIGTNDLAYSHGIPATPITTVSRTPISRSATVARSRSRCS